MKKIGIFCLFMTFVMISSCKKNETEKAVAAAELIAEKTISVACYQSVYEKDTLNMTVNTLENGKVSGDLEMAISEKPKKIGKIAGEVKGDTLFVSYTFIEGENKDLTFKNPMALLKRGDELILGNGKMQTTMGATYFVKGEPIDFDRVKYKFTTVECDNK